MGTNSLTADDFLEGALTLAQRSSWQAFSLVELTDELACTLNDINQFFRSKDDMAEALFSRADKAVLDLASDEEFIQLSDAERLIKTMTTWFEYLRPYKSIIREMLAYKLEPGHFHLQAHGVTRISRTVQWFLEVSDRKNTGVGRAIDEVKVSGLYLSAMAIFLLNDNEPTSCIEKFLKNRLNGKICY